MCVIYHSSLQHPACMMHSKKKEEEEACRYMKNALLDIQYLRRGDRE